jgi:hypothetical protein
MDDMLVKTSGDLITVLLDGADQANMHVGS